MRASELLGATAYDAAGARLGTITELICRPDKDAAPRIVAVLVSPGRRHRLLGYERPGIQLPWLLERLIRWLHRGEHEVDWADLRLTPPAR